MRARRSLSILAALSLLFAACGDDDDTAETPEGTVTTDDVDAGRDLPDDVDTGRDLSADQAIADAAVLTLADMPSGWVQVDDEDDEDDREDQEAIAECLGVDVDELYGDEDGASASTTFESADGDQIDSGVSLAETVDEATFRFSTLTSDDGIDCLREMFSETIEESADDEGMEILDFRMSRMSAAQVGDESVALRATVSLAAQGMEVDVYVDFLVARLGRATVNVSHMSIFTAPSIEVTENYIEIVIDRIDPADVS